MESSKKELIEIVRAISCACGWQDTFQYPVVFRHESYTSFSTWKCLLIECMFRVCELDACALGTRFLWLVLLLLLIFLIHSWLPRQFNSLPPSLPSLTFRNVRGADFGHELFCNIFVKCWCSRWKQVKCVTNGKRQQGNCYSPVYECAHARHQTTCTDAWVDTHALEGDEYEF